MAKKKRLKLGDIYEIKLPNGKRAYGRLFKEYTLGIYTGFYDNFEEVPENAVYYRFIGVYKDILQDNVWRIVGNRPFKNEEESWPPPMCVVDAITRKGSLYYKGKIVSCTYDECKDLEIAAAWDRHHVVDMLMGNTTIDENLRKPIE